MAAERKLVTPDARSSQPKTSKSRAQTHCALSSAPPAYRACHAHTADARLLIRPIQARANKQPKISAKSRAPVPARLSTASIAQRTHPGLKKKPTRQHPLVSAQLVAPPSKTGWQQPSPAAAGQVLIQADHPVDLRALALLQDVHPSTEWPPTRSPSTTRNISSSIPSQLQRSSLQSTPFSWAVRVVGFLMRAILTAKESLHGNENLFVTAEILFGVGFFALLYSAYTLVLDREHISAPIDSRKPAFEDSLPFIVKLTRNRRLFRMLLTAGVVLMILGIVDSTSNNTGTQNTGSELRRASTILFLVLTGIQALQTVLAFLNNQADPYAEKRRFGDQHGTYILALISIFILIREIFLTATVGNSARQNEERLWYPLVALPEVLSVLCYSISGLVPPRAELKKRERERELGVNGSGQQTRMQSLESRAGGYTEVVRSA
uniref:Uncharacterized protein n=1 Tax=Mycena chlorophos TaxID=658473 RepID=A0ABQ0KZW9_MYCCL|nr:predicted protein [Mycena chlorophos]